MALARLITRTPEFAQHLAQSLEAAGYAVEFMDPESSPSGAADLEVNLDDPSAASSYLMTPDGKEISFAYDPIEREFILAPVWRRVTKLFQPLMARLHRKTTRQDHTAPPATAPEVPAPNLAKVEAPPSDEDLSPTTVLPALPPALEPLAQSLYLPDQIEVEAPPLPEPVRFTGVEFFDGQGSRRRPGTSPATSSVTSKKDEKDEKREDVVATHPSSAPLQEEIATPLPSAQETRTPWLVGAALQAEALRSSLVTRLKTKHASLEAGRRLRGHDASWLRAAPVAALLALTFLLGWALSGSQRSDVAHPGSAVDQASPAAVVPAPEIAVKPVAQKRVAAKTTPTASTAAAAPRPLRRAVEDEDGAYDGEDVVVRHYPKHYPSKGVRAAKEPTVKRFSDID